MFVKFDKVFKKKNQAELNIPDSLLAHISKSLPEGLSYTATEDGFCYVTAESGEVNISGLYFRPTDKQREALGETFSHADVMEYMYNSQQQLRLELETPGKIKINGQEIPVGQFVQNPFKQVELVDGAFYAMPKQFPPPFELTIGSSKYQRKVMVSRVPNESVHTAKFESDPEAPFVLRYLANEKKQTLKFSVSLNLKKATTIRDFVESADIFNAFMDGLATMEGHPIPTKVEGNVEKKFDESSIVFWEKVMKIEEYLGVTFTPPSEDVDYETICTIEQLYQSFFFNKPTRELQRVNSISGTLVPESGIDPQEYVGKPMFFIFETEANVNLFGSELKLYGIVGMCSAIIADFKAEGEKYTMTFGDISEEQKFFTSVIYFKDEQSMHYCRDNCKNLAQEMQSAQTPGSYIKRVNEK